MGLLQFFQWGILLQVLAVLHFIRRRPDTFWLWIIIFFGPLGAFIYILMEVVPDLGLIRHSFEGFGRRKRISTLEALVQQNPAAGNYEDLGDLYLDEGKYAEGARVLRQGDHAAHDACGSLLSPGSGSHPDGGFLGGRRGSRARHIARSEVRLESRAGSAGTRLRQHRTAGGRGDVSSSGRSSSPRCRRRT